MRDEATKLGCEDVVDNVARMLHLALHSSQCRSELGKLRLELLGNLACLHSIYKSAKKSKRMGWDGMG